MRTLNFQQIIDSRFGEDLSLLLSRVEEIQKELKPFANVELHIDTPRQLFWHEPEPSYQWRVDCQIRKRGRNPSWEKIMQIINKVKAPFYSFV